MPIFISTMKHVITQTRAVASLLHISPPPCQICVIESGSIKQVLFLCPVEAARTYAPASTNNESRSFHVGREGGTIIPDKVIQDLHAHNTQTHARTHAHTHTHTHASTHTHAHTTHTRMHAKTRTHTDRHTRIQAHTYTLVVYLMRTHASIRTHTRLQCTLSVHTQAYAHTRLQCTLCVHTQAYARTHTHTLVM